MNSSYDSYLKAQREYDNQLPDDMEDEEESRSRQEALEEYYERKSDEDREERMIEAINCGALDPRTQATYWQGLEGYKDAKE
jgi:hypothetical protein